MTDRENATVLIVDDDPDRRETYAGVLAPEYSVRTATDGTVFAALDGAVDAVLLQRHMPRRTGEEVLRGMRDRGYDRPVAMLSDDGADVDVVDVGVDDCVRTPVSGAELREVVASLLRRRTCDDLLRESFALSAALSAIEVGGSDVDAESSDAYARLEARLRSVRSESREAIADLGTGGLARLYDSIAADGPTRGERAAPDPRRTAPARRRPGAPRG